MRAKEHGMNAMLRGGTVRAVAVWMAVLLCYQCFGAVENDANSIVRTRAEVEALIRDEGSKAPEWWDAVALKYPKTMDLSWKQDGGAWNNQRKVGCYVWDIINPNPGRWREGARFMHHVLSVNKGNREAIRKAMESLGHIYGNLLEDHARAAFWWRKTGGDEVRLAHCYWELGCREMAAEALRKVRVDYSRYGDAIKLWADMGEYGEAIKMANVRAKAGYPSSAYLAAGDACRLGGRYRLALNYYEKAISATGDRQNQGILDFVKRRAKANIEAVKLFDALDLTKVADGVYRSNSIAYAGQLYVEVTVKSGRIEEVKVTKHKEKQFYNALTETPRQIIDKQSVKGVDAVTGATMTSEAIINATAKALSGAMN